MWVVKSAVPMEKLMVAMKADNLVGVKAARLVEKLVVDLVGEKADSKVE